MAQMIQEAVANALANMAGLDNPGPPGPSGPPGPPGPNGQLATPDASWKISEIGCFDPDNKATTTIRSINHINHYTDVYSWADHLRDIAQLKSEEVVRSHMSYSLKNKATN